jgi:hypothetical protein
MTGRAFAHRIVGVEGGYLVMEERQSGARWTSTLTPEDFGPELLTDEERAILAPVVNV